jgi:hypothetical protein
MIPQLIARLFALAQMLRAKYVAAVTTLDMASQVVKQVEDFGYRSFDHRLPQQAGSNYNPGAIAAFVASLLWLDLTSSRFGPTFEANTANVTELFNSSLKNILKEIISRFNNAGSNLTPREYTQLTIDSIVGSYVHQQSPRYDDYLRDYVTRVKPFQSLDSYIAKYRTALLSNVAWRSFVAEQTGVSDKTLTDSLTALATIITNHDQQATRTVIQTAKPSWLVYIPAAMYIASTRRSRPMVSGTSQMKGMVFPIFPSFDVQSRSVSYTLEYAHRTKSMMPVVNLKEAMEELDLKTKGEHSDSHSLVKKLAERSRYTHNPEADD